MIQFKCQSCRQEMSAPDSMAGHFEECPACKVIVAVPGPHESDVPASWHHGRAASAGAARLLRLGGSKTGKYIWGLVLAALGFGALIMIAAAAMSLGLPEAAAKTVCIIAAAGMFICVAALAIYCGVLIAMWPGTIARSRGLANADGLMALGVLGIFIPIVWLVALVLALAGTPPESSR